MFLFSNIAVVDGGGRSVDQVKMTPEEFGKLRGQTGRSWGPPFPPDNFADDRAKVNWQRRYIARLVGMSLIPF